MRNAIQYYYGIEVENINYENDKYYFDNYILTPIYKEIDINLYNYITSINLNNYEIIMNKDNKMVTNINNQEFLLLKKNIKYTLNFTNLEKIQIPIRQKQIVAWDTLWETKIDYYEKHVKTLSSNRIKSSFHYYVGLGENAIRLYKEVKKEDTVYLSHLRLKSNEDYLNPINYIVDYRVRDVAEYVKKLFFEDKLNVNDIYLYFIRNHFSSYECLLFFIRILYPSYFFDAYDLVVHGADDQVLEHYISRISEYETFLKNMYLYLRQYIDIPRIEWLITKKRPFDRSIFHPYL